MSADSPKLEWVVLTMGDRPAELAAALGSIADQPPAGAHTIVVQNGGDLVPGTESPGVRWVASPENVGVPGGRSLGAASGSAELIGFLDDDARLLGDVVGQIVEAFDANPRLGAVSLRLVDEAGESDRRHVPRPGGKRPDESGPVALFLGGASVFRREAFEAVGGYFDDLFYGHEELELSWRLIDAGWDIEYLADAMVFHPRTEISRHSDGWFKTGRNRIWVARRTLPHPISIVHVLAWLVLGVVRAPAGECRRSYLKGWKKGWSGHIDRNPISWSGVWRLVRLGRPPVI